MKKVPLIFRFLLLLMVFGPSCSKKNDSKPACKIITITDVGSNGTTTFNLSYNSDGKIATLQSTLGSISTGKVFTYNGNVILIATSGSEQSTDSLVVNGDGLIQSVLHVSGSYKSTTTYTYSGTQLQNIVTKNNDDAPTTITATYTNGDLTSMSDGETFSYNIDKGSSSGDYLGLAQLIQYGANFVKTAHQLKSFQSGSTTENFSYAYDSNGNITVLTATSGSNIETVTYQYNCNN